MLETMKFSKMALSALALCAMFCEVAISSDHSSSKRAVTEPRRQSNRNSHWLSDEQLVKRKRLVLAGDLASSYCLANHYSYAAPLHDPERSYWILLAAENGDADAMMKISEIYRTGDDLRARARAEFWRVRAEATKSQVDVDCR
jgi:hypothetical protein